MTRTCPMGYIYSMKTTSSIIAMLAVCIFAIGCQEAQQPEPPDRPRASIEGIKITDLVPPDTTDKPKEVSMQVYTYEIPSSSNDTITEIFSGLHTSYLRFASHKTFRENGFEAGFGQNELWPITGNALYRSSARKVSTNNLLFWDSLPNDAAVGRSFQDQAFYLYGRRGQKDIITLSDGQLLLRINAIALPKRKGVCLIQIKMLHKEVVLSAIKNIPGYENTGETNFNDLSIKLNMSPGDFVVLGPTLQESDQVKLGDLYFKRRGSVIVQKSKEELNNTSDSNKATFKIKKDAPLTRLYIIACVGVEN